MAPFVKDKNARVVFWQRPNLLLWGWVVCKMLSISLQTEPFKTGFGRLSTAIIFAWAYLEISKGVNFFRKFLGCVVLILVILSYFK